MTRREFIRWIGGVFAVAAAIPAWAQSIVFGAVTPAANWFVDSVGGSDSNNGTSVVTPFQTITHLLAQPIASGDLIALKCGSHFREQLTLPLSKVNVCSYGSGARPILDCSDVVTGFTQVGATAAWTKSVTFDPNTTGPSAGQLFMNVWENSVNLTLAASLAACESTAGSYYVDQLATSPCNLYVHATGSSNPNTNGKTYEYNSRCFGIVADPNSLSHTLIDGCQTQRNLGGNGSVAVGNNSIISSHLAKDGSKHNVFGSGGCVFYNVEAHNQYFGGGNATMFIIFGSGASDGSDVEFINCYAHCDTLATNTVGVFTHFNSGPGWGTATFTTWQDANLATGIDFGGCKAVNISGGSSTNSIVAIQPEALIGGGTTAVSGHTAISSVGHNLYDVQANAIATFTSCTVTNTNANYTAISGGQNSQVTATNCTLSAVTRTISHDSASTTGTLTVNGTIFLAGTFEIVTNSLTGVAYTGDHNDYSAIATPQFSHDSAATAETLSQWQAATGQDQHSTP